MMDEYWLSPIQEVGGYLCKRDDLFRPYGKNDVNGGKLRQCIMLLKSLPRRPERVYTYCSIHSPQAPITAGVCEAMGIPCTVLYGGTTVESLKHAPMSRLSLYHGAKVQICASSGRHSVLHSYAKKTAREDDFIVQYGINLVNHSSALLTAVANQTENIPDRLDNLFMVCGSGITATGVMIGLRKFGKRVDHVNLICTAPNRDKFIHENLRKFDADRDFRSFDLYSQKGFLYERGCNVVLDGVKLHPNYEAKMFSYLIYHTDLKLKEGNNLFWITGAEPSLAGR